MERLLAVLILSLLFFSAAVHGAIWYVDDNAPAVGLAQDGTSWERAFDTIQEGVDAAFYDGGGEVWVAMGIYMGVGDPVLALKEVVHVYGGFLGNAIGGFETARSQRDWATHATIIDGRSGHRCVCGADDATLDGFTLVNGRGYQPPMTPLSLGGGVHNDDVSPTIANCLIVNCTAKYGGAVYNVNSSAEFTGCVILSNHSSIESTVSNGGAGTPRFVDCVFALNTALYGAAAVGNVKHGGTEYRRCIFAGNSAISVGGPVENGYGSPIMTNCLFVGNSGPSSGAIYNFRGATSKIVNCTFDRNEAGTGAGAIVSYSEAPDYITMPTVTNCILWNSGPAEISDDADSVTSVTYSDVMGVYAGEGNFYPSRTPRFVGGPSGFSTGLAYDTPRYRSVLTRTGAGFEPGAFVNAILWLTVGAENFPYVITANDTESITVWGDATKGGTVTSPVDYAIIDYHLSVDSPCLDAGRDTSGAEYGSVTDDMNGDPRGQDGAGDGPTGPPPPGDGSDYDMGAYENARLLPPSDIDRSGDVDAIDIQLVINAALGIATGYDCDVDGDGQVTAVDVQLVINAALGIG